MMINWLYGFISYFLSLFFFFNYSNCIFFWIMMEFNLLCFILLMFMLSNLSSKDCMNHVLYYFLIQSSASILFLSNFLFEGWGNIFNSDYMFIFSLLMKIGLFPLFFWIFILSESLGLISLFFLLSFQKFPIMMFFFSGLHELSFYFLVLSFVSGSIMIFFSSSLIFLLISSSISYALMMFFLYNFSISFFSSFYLVYSFFLLMVLYEKVSILKGTSPFLFLFFIFFLGLPPVGGFFYKFIFCSNILFHMGLLEMIVFWIFTFFSLIGYTKMFFFSFYSNKVLYLKNEFWFKKMSMMVYTLAFFVCFLV